MLKNTGYKLLFKILNITRRKEKQKFYSYGLKEQIDAVNKLPIQIKKSIGKYTMLMNISDTKFTQEDENNIVEAFNFMPELKHDIILYRALKTRYNESFNDDYNIQIPRSRRQIRQLPRPFISTSINEQNHSFGTYLYRIHVPAGSKILPTITLSIFPEDSEVLIQNKPLIIGQEEIHYTTIKDIDENGNISDHKINSGFIIDAQYQNFGKKRKNKSKRRSKRKSKKY